MLNERRAARKAKKPALGPTGIGMSGYGTAGTDKKGKPVDMTYGNSTISVGKRNSKGGIMKRTSSSGKTMVDRGVQNKARKKDQKILKKINKGR